jgi:predicted RNA-binding Zn ribbon-like protein
MPDPDPSATVADGTAPGPLSLVQAFANTLRAREGEDLLRAREEAATWLRAAGLLPADSGVTGSEHGALLRLRDSIREVLAAHTGGRRDADAAARLTRALADGRLVLTVDSASTVGLASAARASYPNIVAVVAVAIAASAAAGTWLHLKACGAAGCGQAFYDGSASAAADRCAAHAAG